MDVVLPKNSLTMTEAEVLEWYVEVGAEVVAGQVLFLMETEKSQVEVEATASGTLAEVRCEAGTVAAAGDVIAVIDTGKSDSSFTSSSSSARVVAPAAAELAQQLGIDIDAVRGSGSGGRVIEEDVLRAVQQQVATPPEPPPSVAPTSRPAEFSKNRIVGNRSTRWAADVPTFHLSALVSMPTRSRPDRATASDLLLAAAAAAGRAVPVANAFVDDQGDVQLYESVRLGLLVRDGDALLPLVFADPDRGPLGELHTRRRELMRQVGKEALPADATAWPTLVVSNIGRPTVRWFTAVLFPGTTMTVAVGGLGAQQANAVEVVLTCDHRALDGVDAADFISAMSQALTDM